VEIEESVRGMDTFLSSRLPSCQSESHGTAYHARRPEAGVSRSHHGRHAYYGYARQDRKVTPRAPYPQLVADLMEVAGASRILAMDLPCGSDSGLLRHTVDTVRVARPA